MDIIFRISPSSMGWDPQLCPVIIAAAYRTEEEDIEAHAAAARLSNTFRITMIILILYYLDTRAQPNTPLPSWMYLMGLVYTETGFTVHVHYPIYHSGWKICSSSNTNQFWNISTIEGSQRGRAINTLYRIRGHGLFVLQKLKEWDGYERVVKSLFID